MSKRGRRPKPTKLHAIEGTGNVTRMRTREKEPEPPDHNGEPPSWLSKEAAEKWRQLSPELLNCGILTVADTDLFSMYCEKWVEWQTYKRKIRKTSELVKTPGGHVQQNPYIGMANRAFDQLVRLGAEFGLSPSSRSRVPRASDDEKKKEDRFFPTRSRN